jgi:bacteriorhodopsin
MMQYTIVASLGSAAIVTIGGRPWMWPRYAGWLSTCPVLLIDVSMVPMPAARRPALAMTSILAQQLMVLLGMTSIFYDNIYLRTSIFLAAVAFGLFVFKIVAETFVRAWNSFPEKEGQMRSWLIISAALFFVG